MAHELELIFTQFVVEKNGQYSVAAAAIAAAGYGDSAPQFQAIADAINGTSLPSASTLLASGTNSPQGGFEFASCAIGNALGVGILATPGLVSATVTAIKAFNWGLAATTIARIVGPVALKSVGGVPGLAAQLAVALWACRGEL